MCVLGKGEDVMYGVRKVLNPDLEVNNSALALLYLSINLYLPMSICLLEKD